ncbi:dihydrodipicolinate synthase family protein [Tropicimonas aquimaris]|uniref:Dihydrodipicolinate synthase family protein n=1 Tax=Tropicimonas aquimaris TaxID=914152 RepID=A0ABW3IUM8_9RHOB
MTATLDGIVPVMITPMTDDDRIDWDGYAALVEWYLAHGSQALFAVCQSSEMYFLSLEERVELARFTVELVDRRVPVIASGHIAGDLDGQKEELSAITATGIDGLVLVTNRLAAQDEDAAVLRSHLDSLLGHLPGELLLGLYECPAPYRRLLTDDEIKYCADTGRFGILKDVSCDLDVIRRRVALTRGSPLRINNANAAIAWSAMQAGGGGFCGVFNNFHPDLYRWLQDHGAEHPALAEELSVFLALAALTEPMGHPKITKLYHQRLGTFASTHSRAVSYDIRERFWALEANLERIEEGIALYRRKIAALKPAAD